MVSDAPAAPDDDLAAFVIPAGESRSLAVSTYKQVAEAAATAAEAHPGDEKCIAADTCFRLARQVSIAAIAARNAATNARQTAHKFDMCIESAAGPYSSSAQWHRDDVRQCAALARHHAREAGKLYDLAECAHRAAGGEYGTIDTGLALARAKRARIAALACSHDAYDIACNLSERTLDTKEGRGSAAAG